jgi:hypothetical protein
MALRRLAIYAGRGSINIIHLNSHIQLVCINYVIIELFVLIKL